MRILVTLLTLVALLAPSVPAHPATAPDEALPTDPALTTGRLPNGLRYIIRPHRNPEGRVGIWLHVGSGSFNETETTQGLAHYLEHMAFNGSANFAPGSVVPFFQSLGLAFGRDQNAFTSFDQTTYQLTLPGADRDLLAKGMLFMSDVALRLSLDPTAIDSERHVILEEKRARASARQRVQDELFAQLAPESTLGRRLPIGIEPTIKAVTATDFRDYYTRWYVPSNMTVLVVGDTDPATVADVIRQQFGSGPAVPLPPPRDVGVKPTAGPRAIVVTDPELTRAEVSIARLQPPLAPVTTVTQRRREIVEAMGSWAFNRRMSALVAAGQAAFLNADASLDDWPRALRMVTVAASGRPDTWRAMLSDLGTELQRARLHGFTERELQDARAAFVADAEEAVRRETTRPAREVLRALNRAVTAETPPMSATQRLALLQRVLPGITAREVSDIFAAAFDPGRALFICELPVTDDVPSEADLLALGRTAVDVKPDKPADVARAAALLATLPGGGAVVDSRTHAASGITSMWLDNGVRVHHRFVDQRKHEATIAITLAGGVIEETAANRGITEAALRAWQRPATSTLSSTQIRDLLTGAKVRVRAGMTGDTVSLSVSGDPAELERGLQLAYLLLTDPLIETAALEQWKDAEAQRLHERKRQPMQALMDVQTAALYPPGETRPQSLTLEQVRAITRAGGQAWLERLITDAPLEVSVVGEIDRESATRLVLRYLGALPSRARIGDKTLANLRTIARPQRAVRVEQTIEALTPQGAVLAGFFGADLRDLRDMRLLNLAAQVLSTRMLKSIRQEKGLVYSIRAASEPGVTYPGFGVFVAVAPTEPGKVHALSTALEETFARFAKDGPTVEELTVAKKQTANLLDETLKTPDYWSSALATLDYRGLTVGDLLDAPAQYERFTAREVQDTFASYDRPAARFLFVITPRS
ncbi:MAG: insulinase family protein [Candidatus Rokuibacteriota bacterium]|nr:MAG: insulinase family protein [Candidatus Rokubacteria bacterium]